MKGVDEEVLRRLYLEDKKPMHEVAELIGISIGSVYNYCHKYGIETRSQKDTFTFNGNTHTKSARERISRAHKGKHLSDDTKRKMSAAKKVGGIGHKKVRRDGYIAVYFPDHPRSTKEGYIMEHDLVMESVIGRWLNPNEVVHHINKIKADNRIENLLLMTKSEHASLHARERHATKRKE